MKRSQPLCAGRLPHSLAAMDNLPCSGQGLALYSFYLSSMILLVFLKQLGRQLEGLWEARAVLPAQGGQELTSRWRSVGLVEQKQPPSQPGRASRASRCRTAMCCTRPAPLGHPWACAAQSKVMDRGGADAGD